MVFNSFKNGFENEKEFVESIHNKKFNELNFNLQLFIEDLFGHIENEKIIKCYQNEEKKKFDICIKIDGKEKLVSIKKGIKNSIHTEPVSIFFNFLKTNHIPRNMFINLLKYHYADGTTNGTGKNRISVNEYKLLHQNEINEINSFFNNELLLKKYIERFIIKGRNSNVGIDALLYGTPNDFLWIKTNDIYKILLKKKNIYSSSIHFSSLTYQPLDRCLNNNPLYERRRFIIQIKWYNLCDDIIECMNDNVSNAV